MDAERRSSSGEFLSLRTAREQGRMEEFAEQKATRGIGRP